MTETKKMPISRCKNGKQVFNFSTASGPGDNGFGFVEWDSFVAQLADGLRTLSDESRRNVMIEILAIVNRFTRADETQ